MSEPITPETVQRINAMIPSEARETFLRCCGAERWADAMVSGCPYPSWEQLEETSNATWSTLTEHDWREAFAHHPKIGDIDSLRTKFGSTRDWASGEQAGAASASEATLQALADGNTTYEARFGYIFIVCATGKTADEMLRLLQARLTNDPEAELKIAAAEQIKITELRLRKL